MVFSRKKIAEHLAAGHDSEVRNTWFLMGFVLMTLIPGWGGGGGMNFIHLNPQLPGGLKGNSDTWSQSTIGPCGLCTSVGWMGPPDGRIRITPPCQAGLTHRSMVGKKPRIITNHKLYFAQERRSLYIYMYIMYTHVAVYIYIYILYYIYI